MKVLNVNKLRGKIVENGLSTGELAKRIGVDRSTLYRKMNNNGDSLTIKEVRLISKELNLSHDEAMAIFFSSFVA
ncbi:helix-turn-helix domain-containing protein [Salipaludibacillus sp. HK11]|uniref:helix-turn-helix domain-containing protein n=1 Tax=Salipaludibacillus sp. HK11 TaxID=3394320 RepID=UPI0039FC3A52